jgi:hypothetical protein
MPGPKPTRLAATTSITFLFEPYSFSLRYGDYIRCATPGSANMELENVRGFPRLAID